MPRHISYLKARYFESKKNWKAAVAEYKKAVAGSDDLPAAWYYRLGFCLSKAKSWKEAVKYLRIAVKKVPDKVQWKYRLAVALDNADGKEEALRIYQEVLERQGNDPAKQAQVGKLLLGFSRWSAAEDAFRSAISLNGQVAEYYNLLAQALRKQSKWWQEIEALESAVKLDGKHAAWFYRLGEAQEAMSRFDDAANSYDRAAALKNKESAWHYRKGYALERAGKHVAAQAAYAEAIKRDTARSSKDFGIGVFHQERGLWPEAARAYAARLYQSPLGGTSADLAYRLGMAHDRCYEWRDAAVAYERALLGNPSKPEWHYRLGFVRERTGLYIDAALAYGHAADTAKKLMPYWFYRQGYVLAKAGQYQKACVAFMRMQGKGDDGTEQELPDEYLGALFKKGIEALLAQLKSDATSPDLHFEIAESYKKAGDWSAAVQYYASAIARKETHNQDWYCRLGEALARLERYEEATDAFTRSRIFQRPFGVDTAPYVKDAALKAVMEYTEYLETLPVKESVVLYESYLGASFSCNPMAIFRQIIDDEAYADWTHVWVLNDKTRIPKELRSRGNIIFIARDTDLHRRYLATASHLISNVTFPAWFIRRPEQKYLNTWHGTPLKALGKDITGEFMAHSNVSRNFLHATHIISPNAHTSDVLINGYDIRGAFTGKLAETGYPRIDLTINASDARKAELRRCLGLSEVAPVVLYAPTWRGEHGAAEVDVARLMKDLEALSILPCQMVFRGHHFMESALAGSSLPVKVASQDIDASELLSIVDVLITDYSSIAFDFLPKDRPIFYYAYDLESYMSARSMYFRMEEMPGTVCLDIENLCEALSREVATSDRQRRVCHKQKGIFCPHEDGSATRRVIDFFFGGDDSAVVDRYSDERKSVLFYNGPFIPNGITSSFLNLVESLGSGDIRIGVVIEPDQISKQPDRREMIERLPAYVQVIGRVGRLPFSPEEKWIHDKVNARFELASPEMWEAYRATYEREFKRIFGYAKFESLVNFEGYNRLWGAIFACAPGQESNKSIYLHNDMASEWVTRFPYLKLMFKLYGYYDALISVSRTMRNINFQNLAELHQLSSDHFDYCNNTLNIDAIRATAQEPLDEDIATWIGKRKSFVTMGRLSLEKDHRKLIRAFAKVIKEFPESCLLILGDGPLRNDLQFLIRELQIEAQVLLAGRRSNPFPALLKADCFVLSSNHEGQPMVLLESMVLGRPIVATDIDGNRGVLGGKYGLLVENSEDGLISGMREFLKGKSLRGEFDAAEYQKDALQSFKARVMTGLAKRQIDSPVEVPSSSGRQAHEVS